MASMLTVGSKATIRVQAQATGAKAAVAAPTSFAKSVVPSSKVTVAAKRVVSSRGTVQTLCMQQSQNMARGQPRMNLGIPHTFTDENFVAYVQAAFPDKGVADIEEARTLYEMGYVYLDVRSQSEVDENSTVPKAIHVPLIDAKKRWNSEINGKETIQTVNPDFLTTVQRYFPDKSARIMVGCSDGRNRSIQVLMLLDEAGYTNLVGIQGGFNKWDDTFDKKLGRRRADGYMEDYGGMGETACGIHGTGASFDRVDALDKLAMIDEVEWINWKQTVGA